MSPTPSPLRFPLVAVFGGLITSLVAAGPLEPFRDKNRLILLSLPAASVEKTTATLAEFRARIEERDLKIIDLSPRATGIPQALRMTAEQTARLRKEYRLADDETRAVFILIGKDGGEKARQSGALDLHPWCALIDQMPMRRQEMKERRH